MSRDNVEAARRVHEAFNRTFTDGSDDLFELVDPEIEWIPITAALEGTSYRGEDGIRAWMAEMRREWEFYETRPEVFRDLGEGRVLILGTWGARGRGSGVELGFAQAAWLFGFKAGKINRMQTFTDRDKALEAAGIVA
ncbi:MAG: nuclear transport factor 2 family protein [Thermoleophilaceae bacterium]